LNDHPKISTRTKSAVKRIAKQLNYQPNNIAAALRNGRSKIIGVVIPRIDDSLFSLAVRGIEEVANKSHYNVMICQTHDSFEKEVETVEVLLNSRVDGIIASFSKNTMQFDHLLKIRQRGTPLILFDRTEASIPVNQVGSDDFLGGYRATTHLIEQGYRSIAHFTSSATIHTFQERLRGYKQALADHGIRFDESLVQNSNLLFEDGHQCIKKLLSLPRKVDAVFSANALSAMGAIQALKEAGKKIPQEVGIVGFNDEVFTIMSTPQLSTIDQHNELIGNAAANLFLEELNKESVISIPRQIVIEPHLIIRKSSLRMDNTEL
jgi:LacI family transcriptional regulator